MALRRGAEGCGDPVGAAGSDVAVKLEKARQELIPANAGVSQTVRDATPVVVANVAAASTRPIRNREASRTEPHLA
jgi:hypothetical protein